MYLHLATISLASTTNKDNSAFFAMILYPSEANSLVSIHLVNKVTQFVNMYLSLIYPSVD